MDARPFLKLLNWNARSVVRKKLELLDFCLREEVDILVLTETHLQPKVSFSLPYFKTVRLDRTEGVGGGVAIAIRSNISARVLPHFRTSLIEALGVEVELSGSKLIVIAAYCPKQCSNDLKSTFNSDLSKITRFRQKFIVAGDLNARHENWNNNIRNCNGKLLFNDSLFGHYQICYPFEATFLSSAGYPSTLDFFLTNLNTISQPQVHNELSSDHYPVSIEIAERLRTTGERSRKDYHHVDWMRFQRCVESKINFLTNLETTENIDTCIANLEQAITQAEDECIRKLPVAQRVLQLDNYTKLLIRYRNIIRRQAQRTRNPVKQILQNRLNKLIASRVDRIKNINFEKEVSKLKQGSRPFWQVTKLLKNKPLQIPPLKSSGSLLVSPVEKANAIGEHIVASHNLGSEITSPMEPVVLETLSELQNTRCYVPADKRITGDQIRLATKNSKNMKAPGFDGILNLALKNLSTITYDHLANVFNRCLELHYFPERWKTAKVIPIPKPGKDPSLASSYRPISLLSSMSKVFERLILDRFLLHVNTNSILLPEQFGFRHGHSTTHQLRRVVNIINNNKRVAKSTAMATLDVEKAFDNVWHHGLIYKLFRYNFPIYLIKIIQAYLSNRNFKVVIKNLESLIFHIAAGVPQGSLIGPSLYTVYTSDLPPLPDGCFLSLFADDTAILCKGRATLTAKNKLQQSLDLISDYSKTWKIKINSSKTNSILFTYNNSPSLVPPTHCRVVMDGSIIEWSDEVVYLGLTLDRMLLFRNHVDKVVNRAAKLTKCLYPLIGRRAKTIQKNKILIYKQIFLPMLLYASPVWGCCATSHKNKIQNVQNKSLKMILNVPHNTRTDHIHNITNTPTIENNILDRKRKFQAKCTLSPHNLINTLF